MPGGGGEDAGNNPFSKVGFATSGSPTSSTFREDVGEENSVVQLPDGASRKASGTRTSLSRSCSPCSPHNEINDESTCSGSE